MSEDKGLVPELRFPEFVGEWKVKQVGDVVVSESSNVALNKLELKSTGYPVYGADSIVGYINDFQQSEKYVSIVKDGSGVGRLNFCESQSSVLGTLAYLKSYNQENYDILWIYYLLNTINFSSYVKGSGIPHIYFSDFKSEKIAVPKPNEQQKIASCLSSLDDLIAAHSQKLDLLKEHKKGLMQNLFPQEGETLPKIRFPEFVEDGDWVEEVLGDYLIGKPEYGINAPAVPYSEKLPKYLRITDISEDGKFLEQGKVSVDREVTENNYLFEGDIVLARTGASVGKSYKYKKSDGRLVFAGFLIRIKPNPIKGDSEFIFQSISTSKFWNWVSFISARSGQPGINGTEYSSMPLNFPPTIIEQQKIAACLSALDELIAAQASKIAQLQSHKKGLMQGLFPKVG